MKQDLRNHKEKYQKHFEKEDLQRKSYYDGAR